MVDDIAETPLGFLDTALFKFKPHDGPHTGEVEYASVAERFVVQIDKPMAVDICRHAPLLKHRKYLRNPACTGLTVACGELTADILHVGKPAAFTSFKFGGAVGKSVTVEILGLGRTDAVILGMVAYFMPCKPVDNIITAAFFEHTHLFRHKLQRRTSTETVHHITKCQQSVIRFGRDEILNIVPEHNLKILHCNPQYNKTDRTVLLILSEKSVNYAIVASISMETRYLVGLPSSKAYASSAMYSAIRCTSLPSDPAI